MRVLHVFKVYYPEILGGVQRVIHDIAEGTVDHGVTSRVFALSQNPTPGPVAVGRHSAVTVRQQLYIASTGLSLAAFGAFRREAKAADILHFHFPWPFMDVLHLTSGIRKPAIVTYHSDIVKQSALMRLYKPLMHRFLGSMDRIIATSPNYLRTSQVLTRHGEKTSVIPLGIPRDEIVPDPALVEHWRQRAGQDFFLFMGALRYYKSLPVLLDAARKTNLPVVIAGAGDQQSALEGSAPANVLFAGRYSDADRAALLHLARAFVFPSSQRSEAFGISLLEAARSGIPMISCEIGTGTSYVNRDGETGFVIPPNDAEALAAAMARLATEPKIAARLGMGARSRFEARFTSEQMAGSYMALYRDLLTTEIYKR